MVRTIDIQEKLLHLIGWEQNYDTTDFKIAEELTTSESGIYFQQIHPLLTLQNLASMAPDFKSVIHPYYSADVSYFKGNIVSHESKLYKCTKQSLGNEPSATSEYWAETNPFSEWLEGKTKAGIQKAITRYCNEKAAHGAFKPLCENRTLFDGTGRLADVVKNRNCIVGFEIIPIRAKGVTTKINKIGLQFTEPGNYKLYLMHSSSDTPVKVINLTKTTKNGVQWFQVDDLYLPYQTEFTDAGGSWYLCYKQSELPSGSQAIKKDKDWSKEPCSSCSRNELIAWKAWSKYLEVHPFRIDEASVGAVGKLTNSSNISNETSIVNDRVDDSMIMWDIERNMYTYDNNYGLNLEVSVGCDISDFIIEQRFLFQDVIAKQVAIDLLREFAFNANVRTNRHSINASRVDILYEIDGDSSSLKKSGLSHQLDLAFKAIDLSTQGIDRVCLPCKNNGIKYKTI